MRADGLSEPERRLWAAFARGDKVDLRPAGTAEGPTAEEGSGWGPERTVRASVIRSLVLGGADTVPGETPVVHLVGARVSGKLRLVFAEACCVLRLEKCWFEQAPQLYGARLHVTGFGGSWLPGLGANSVTVEGDLDLMRARVAGTVTLTGAHITGSLLLQGARLSGAGAGTRTGTGTGTGTVGLALDGSRLEVGSGIVGRDGFRAEGEVRLPGARAHGGLLLDGARLHHPGGEALFAEGLQSARVDCGQGFHADGAVVLTGAAIEGTVSFEGGTVQNPAGDAIACSRVQASEAHLETAHTEGTVDLRHARLDVLRTAHGAPEVPDVSPLRLDGLVYRAWEPMAPVAHRLATLRRDPDGYRPQPYQQLAAVCRSVGHDDEARRVLLARQRCRRGTLRPAGRAWGLLLDATVGHGYRPWLAGLWLTALTLLGTAAFGAAGPRPVKPGEGAPFSPLVYTLDLLIPFGGLGQRNSWYWEAGPVQWLAYALVAAGWLLTTAVVAGVTRVLNRS
ncbi:oxidoreductase [Streptomyces daliensis]